jgi:hypothetical protein
MLVPHSFFGYAFCAVAGTLLAIGVSGSPRSPVVAHRYSANFPAAVKTEVNRSRKGDRLPLTQTKLILNTGVIQKTVIAPEHAGHIVPIRPRALEINNEEKRAPILQTKILPGCEPMASPLTDPILGQTSGRCFV